MICDSFLPLLREAKALPEPANLFSGRQLPPGFRIPDNILAFFHDFPSSAPNFHGRWTIVIPFDEMTYYLDRECLELQPGMLLVIPPYAVRFLHPGSKGYRRLFITFDPPGDQPYLPSAGAYVLSPSAREWIHRFLDVFRTGEPEDCSFTLTSFLFRIRSLGVRHPSGRSLPPQIEKAVEYIENHFADHPGIKDVARYVGLSESHLRMMFRQEMKISIGRFLDRKRLDFIKYQLLHSDMSLSEIADRCGFSTVYVFSTFFRRNCGMPPNRFRREYGTPE